MELNFKKRAYHIMPGRLRTELYGLKNTPETALMFKQMFSSIEGIQLAEASDVTGKILIHFDENTLSLNHICTAVSQFEEMLFKQHHLEDYDDKEEYENPVYAVSACEAAATIDLAAYKEKAAGFTNRVSSFLDAIPLRARAPAERIPLPLALSVGGLLILGVKQLFWGRSFFSQHPLLFYMAAGISVVTGYAFFKERIKKASIEGKQNIADMALSVGAIGLALIRENLVVLSALSLIQYLNWKRKSSDEQVLMDQEYVSEKIEAYSRQAGKLGFLSAAAALAVTRNPVISLAVLLAANPRPITVSAEYAWKQADFMARQNNQMIPKNGSVFGLEHLKAVVFEDASLLSKEGSIRKECEDLLNHLSGKTVSYINNKDKVDLAELQKQLADFDVEFVPHRAIRTAKRHDILLVIKEDTPENSKVVSFYPYIRANQLYGIAKTMEYAGELSKVINRNLLITRIWNLAGPILAMPLILSAPLVNLIGDALSLTFISRAKVWTEKKNQSVKELQQAFNRDKTPWHSKAAGDIVSFYKSDMQKGLDQEQVDHASAVYGKNQLVSKTKSHWIRTYVGQFKEFTTQVLGATAILSAVTGHLFDGLIMGAILLINAGIGTVQERKADRAVETMSQFVPPNCRVIRDGSIAEIAAYDLVPGDIVELEAGDRVPADLRILHSSSLEANESALTGESLPVEKKEAGIKEDVPINDRTNLLYMGTHITRGKCKAIVVETGKNTEMGHLLSLLTEEDDHTTPLQRQVTTISKKFMKGALAVGALVFITGLVRGLPLTEMVTTSVALTASAIPEGLPITITFALTAGIFRMAKKKALVRKLSALETLGRTTVICSDKTGTLTKNEMTVKRIVTPDHDYKVTGDGYDPKGKITGEESGDLDQLLRIGLLCNNSELIQEQGSWSIKGDPTEGALLTAAGKRGLWKQEHKQWIRKEEIPFDSSTGKMSVICHEENQHEKCFIMTKGSVEKLLDICSHYQSNGEAVPLNDSMRKKILEQNEELAKEALRVLGFAYRELNSKASEEQYEKNLIYTGMCGMMDPPKADVEKSIRDAVRLGIKPVMITGDHPLTALAIAKQIGIYDGKTKAVTGKELDGISNDELLRIIDDIAIYARVTPEHKLRIVTTLQKKGHVVAMTGDGVNDSPAIKKADVGIAMGKTGTQVTKETADMVLKEDHFGSIVDGVKEGRTIIGNIRKAIGCLLSGNLAEILVTSMAVMAGLPLPVVPVQILLMNMLTDALPAMILAVNPGSKSKETKRQEIVDGSLYRQVITRGAVLGLGSLGLFIWGLSIGLPLAAAQTVAFATLVAGQLIQTFSWRQAGSREAVKDWTKDRFLVGALGVSWLSLFSVIYIPPLAGIFKTAALPLWHWGPILLIATIAARIVNPLSKMWSIPGRSIPQAA
ncbi:cation-translocating P-type ATPase [Peribacillus kribbensis]|uniref:cation-translocating P-type ATPase n=1 Tax=Peribacillus kribbensis TaxID=356658 RepID=UPI00041C5EFF|nr:HAD-IC family P-type ATPase [Peribacillus kribbensis]